MVLNLNAIVIVGEGDGDLTLLRGSVGEGLDCRRRWGPRFLEDSRGLERGGVLLPLVVGDFERVETALHIISFQIGPRNIMNFSRASEVEEEDLPSSSSRPLVQVKRKAKELKDRHFFGGYLPSFLLRGQNYIILIFSWDWALYC